MNFETLIVEKNNDGIVAVTLNRPEIHNAFNEVMIAELTQLFEQLGVDSTVQAISLKGAGKSFCAGADLNWMKKMKDYSVDENYADSVALSRMLQTIDNCPKPVVAMVHGAALGGGVGLLSCCDIVVAREETQFGLTEVRLGLLPAVISPFVIAKIGYSQARALFMTGERFDAQKAMKIGLVHQVSFERDHLAVGEKVVQDLLQTGPYARVLAKQLAKDVSQNLHRDFEILENLTCSLIAEVRVSAEGQEGMSALLEKRKVQWPKI
jgi:methylglutaconyl-CoA hydratase